MLQVYTQWAKVQSSVTKEFFVCDLSSDWLGMGLLLLIVNLLKHHAQTISSTFPHEDP